jgi:hypothetical protein
MSAIPPNPHTHLLNVRVYKYIQIANKMGFQQKKYYKHFWKRKHNKPWKGTQRDNTTNDSIISNTVKVQNERPAFDYVSNAKLKKKR